MKALPKLDERPVLVAVAGPNGSGKTTFYHAHLEAAGLRFVNADVIAGALGLDPYAAAKVAEVIRRQLLQRRESFAFETVFSDPAGDKLAFLHEAAEVGYTVALCYIGLASHELSAERVAMRVSQGGHDVPLRKLVARFPRSLANLRLAIHAVTHVFVFDNSDLRRPFRRLAEFHDGRRTFLTKAVPEWLERVVG